MGSVEPVEIVFSWSVLMTTYMLMLTRFCRHLERNSYILYGGKGIFKMVLSRGARIFHESSSHLKIIGARWMK
jgi:hypothetical protein